MSIPLGMCKVLPFSPPLGPPAMGATRPESHAEGVKNGVALSVAHERDCKVTLLGHGKATPEGVAYRAYVSPTTVGCQLALRSRLSATMRA